MSHEGYEYGFYAAEEMTSKLIIPRGYVKFFLMFRKIVLGLLLAVCCLGEVHIAAQKKSEADPGLKITAHYKERIKNRVLAEGHVEILYKQTKLVADRIELDTETKELTAEGNVVIQMENEVISTDRIHFNLDTKAGEFFRVHGLVQPDITYRAEQVDRKNEEIYGMGKARITSCLQPVPRWQFSCSKAEFKKEDYIKMWNAVLAIKKIPVLYLPYMKYPLDQERSTGFLMPKPGYNGVKGFSYTQAFYWAMKENMDATLSFDYYSAKGMGAGLEYRYLFNRGTGGRMNLFFFDFKDIPGEEKQPGAYIIRLKHNQPLPGNFNLVADVDYQSSFDFLREFDNNFRTAVVSNRRSQVFLSRAWSYFNLNVRASQFETYFQQQDNSIIRRTLPELGFSSSKIKLISPLYFSFSSAFSRWEYGWESAYDEGTQKKSQNLTFNPTLSLPFTSVPWLTLNSSLTSNFAYYFQSYAPGTKKVVNEPLLQDNYSIDLELLGPVVYRVFYGSDKEPKLKHILEPSFSYRYESPVPLSDRIITTAPSFYRNHYVRYGLTNRFLFKEKNMPREILALGLSQTYYLLPEESPLSRFEVEGEIPEFSDISSYLRFYPARKYSLDFSAAFNTYYKTLSSVRMGANLGRPKDPFFLRVNWYKSVNPYRTETVWTRHQISVYGGGVIEPLSLEARAQIDYNIQERELLYSALTLEYHYQCIDFLVDVRIFYFREKPEVQFSFSFGLGNIGKTTDFMGGMGF